MNIPISTLTLEVKLRYASAFIFLGFFVMYLFSIDLLGIISSNTETGFFFYPKMISQLLNQGIISSNAETGFFLSWSIYPFISLLLWSLFNRWYFMVPAMAVLVIMEFLTVTLAIVHSHFIEDNELSIPIILLGFAFVSFGMYVHRNIKSNNRSVHFNLGMIIISCVIPMLPFLILLFLYIIASMIW